MTRGLQPVRSQPVRSHFVILTFPRAGLWRNQPVRNAGHHPNSREEKTTGLTGRASGNSPGLMKTSFHVGFFFSYTYIYIYIFCIITAVLPFDLSVELS